MGEQISDLVLKCPVRTLDNVTLYPADTIISAQSMREMVLEQSVVRHKTCSLLQFGTVKNDLLDFLGFPPYQTIISDRGKIEEIFEDMNNIHIIVPVLETLDYFRQYDLYSYRHFLMVFALSTLLAKKMISNYEALIHLAATGPTHDIGKMCIPLDILRKRSKLTLEEKKIMDSHSAAGYILMSYYLGDTKALASIVARDHHERRNGSGYPRGIMLTDQLVEIIAVCDIYDALISSRSYRATPFDNRTALEEITRMAEEGKIGWNVVKALVALNRGYRDDYRKLSISAEKRGIPPSDNYYGVLGDEDDGAK